MAKLTELGWFEVEKFVTPPIVRKLKRIEAKLVALDWSPITQDNLPKPSRDEVLTKTRDGLMRVETVWTEMPYEKWVHGRYFAFRPLNAPAPPHTGSKEKA